MKRHYKFHQVGISFQGDIGTLKGPWAGKLMEALGFTITDGGNPNVAFSMLCGSRFLPIGRARLYFDETEGGLEIEIEGNLDDVPSELETIPEWDRQWGTPMPADPKDEEEAFGFFTFTATRGCFTVNMEGADVPVSEMTYVSDRIGDIVRAIS